MPVRLMVSKELAKLMNVLSHYQRIQIIEELAKGEKDVNNIILELKTSQSRVSQHLSVLRAHNIVTERKEARHVYYRLTQPDLALWLLQGFKFIKHGIEIQGDIIKAVDEIQDVWG